MIKSPLFLLLASIGPFLIHADEAASAAPVETAVVNPEELELEDKEAEKISLISEAFGHLIAKHIVSLGVNFDMASIIKGLQDAGEGKSSPMPEKECIEAIAKTREAAFKELAQNNLQKADAFMQDNLNKSEIVPLEKGKLHYQIDQQGEGPCVVEGSTPVIRYVGKFIDGSVFGTSKEDDVVILDETIPGFGKGLLGMKEGEKRTLYIHPDLAYGTMGQLPPNSLLIFEVQLLKANSEKIKEAVADTTTTEIQQSEEKMVSAEQENTSPAPQ
jgi:peptidylprolyl isomerase